MAVSPNGQRVYVTNPSSNDVSVIDAGTLTVIATVAIPGAPSLGGAHPEGVLVDPASARVYVANWIDKSRGPPSRCWTR